MDDHTLAGRYRRVRPLGSGGMGDVWLADDLDLGRRVAVKRLRGADGDAPHPEMVERMLREARVVARLQHPAIVTLYDLVRVDGRPHLIMQYVDGESLAERIQRMQWLEWAPVARILADVADALGAAQRAGVLHRDVKPANILLDTEGTALLTDFGIARGDEDTVLTRAGDLVGTVAYMAPEIAREQEPSRASDVWSLGATAYAALEGSAPFAMSSPSLAAMLVRLTQEDAPPPRRAGPLTSLLVRMLATDPAVRPSAEQVAAEARQLLATRTPTPMPGPAPGPPLPHDVAATQRKLPSPYPAPAPPLPPGPVNPPTPVGPPAPVAAPRRRGAWIAAAVLVVLALVGGGVAVALSGDDAPTGQARTPATGETEAAIDDGVTAEPATGDPTPDPKDPPAAPEPRVRYVDLFDVPNAPVLSANGRTTFVPNGAPGASDIAIVDNTAMTMKRYTACLLPEEIVVSGSGTAIYVQCDTEIARLSVTGPQPSQTGGYPDRVGPMRLTKDGNALVVPSRRSIVAVSTRTMDPIGRVDGPGQLRLVHLSGDGKRAFVIDAGPQDGNGNDLRDDDGSVRVYDVSDLRAMRPIGSISLGTDPTGIQADGRRAYVTTRLGLLTVDLYSRRLVSAGGEPLPRKGGLPRTDPHTGEVWLPATQQSLYYYRRLRGVATYTDFLQIGKKLGGEVAFPSGRNAPAIGAVGAFNQVVVIDTRAHKIQQRIQLDFTPRFVKISPDGRRIVAASGGVDRGIQPQLAVIDLPAG